MDPGAPEVKALLLLLSLIPLAVEAAQLPLNVELQEGGKPVRLERFFRDRPVVLQLGYLGCVNLCSTTHVGVDEALSRTGLSAGRDYVALFVSVDPRDERGPRQERKGWHVLTGASAAGAIARAAGFRYSYDEDSGQFSHPAGFVVITPTGRVSRHFGGVRFDTRELREALLQAGEERTQSAFDQLLLVCFHDPENGRYTSTVLAAVRIAMLALLAAAALFAWRRLR